MLPNLFHIGRLSVPTYGVLVATGVLLGIYISAKMAQRQGLDYEKAWDLGGLAVLAAVIGAKVLLIAFNWSWYTAHPADIFSLTTLRAGGVFYGGFIAAVVASMWFIRRNHMPVLRTCDAFAPGLALGHAIGRLGCFAAGCCYGKPTHLPWGVTFTNPLARDISGTPLGEPLHPTQLYESLIEFANFLILYWLLGRKKFEGQVIGAYLFLYGFARFFIEFVRDDPERGAFPGGLSGVQFISILMVIGGGILWIRRTDSPVTATATEPPVESLSH